MSMNFLNFEKSIAEIEAKLEELRKLNNENDLLDIEREIRKLEKESYKLTKVIFKQLTPMQIVQVARHPQRPHFIDYLTSIIDDFDELKGDRNFSAGNTIIGGIGYLNGEPIMVLGIEKGRKTEDKIARNFGMPLPEDYRKSQRLMKLAEKFKLPLLTVIDTPGAYPGIEAEKHNQSEAIARNLAILTTLKTPIISVIIGEGGSGGALALAVSDRLLMLEYSIFSVISPEGCASILWRETKHTKQAAEALKLTAKDLLELGLIDEIIAEPLGGAHRNYKKSADKIKNALIINLDRLKRIAPVKLQKIRYQRIMNYGQI